MVGDDEERVGSADHTASDEKMHGERDIRRRGARSRIERVNPRSGRIDGFKAAVGNVRDRNNAVLPPNFE